jgi:hypothetical protein
MAHRVHGVARAETDGGWTVGGMILAGRVHGSRRDKVLALETDRGRGTTSRRKIIGAATARWLSDIEGKALRGRGEALGRGDAPGPPRRERTLVSWTVHGELR